MVRVIDAKPKGLVHEDIACKNFYVRSGINFNFSTCYNFFTSDIMDSKKIMGISLSGWLGLNFAL